MGLPFKQGDIVLFQGDSITDAEGLEKIPLIWAKGMR